MSKILEDIYYGRIVPWERGCRKDPEFIAANLRITEAKEYFKNMMSTDDYKRLEALENRYTETSQMNSADAFSFGFRLAASLMIEVFNMGIPVTQK